MWFGMAPRLDTESDVCKRDWAACSKYDNLLGPIVNIIWGEGEPTWPFNEYENLHFDNE